MKFSFQIFLLLLIAYPSTLFPQNESNGYFEGSLIFKVEMSGPGAESMNLNEPNNLLQMHIKEGSYIVNLKGGRYPKSFIFVADSNRQYSIDMTKKIAYKFSPHNDLAQKNKKKPIAKFTGLSEEVNGIPCDIYQVRTEDAAFRYYVSDQYRVNTRLYSPKTRAKSSFLIQGLAGRIPLKTIKRQKGLQVVTTLTKIIPQEFSKTQFLIPRDFLVKKRDYRW